MHRITELLQKEKPLVIGLMSGTSGDGIDAALVEISGWGLSTRAKLLDFYCLPYDEEVRGRILAAAGGDYGGSAELCRMNFFLGSLFAEACLRLCEQAGVAPREIDLIGSHGQTVWHEPRPEPYLGKTIPSTLQIGETSVLAEALGCPVVGDFRVRDVAAGGQGAPLVPYTEFLLYRDPARTVALQNIGGIGNITLLPRGGGLSDLLAFDTGPGNMVLDALVSRMTGGAARYDDGGRLAAAGRVSEALLGRMLDDPYLSLAPPKTTGRERYGAAYVDDLWEQGRALSLSPADLLATATRFTAETIRQGVERFCTPRPDRLIVGGGGSHNPVLMRHLADCLPGCEVVANEALGRNSDAKEAVAFAVLANEALHASPNNAPRATGAPHPVVMGKITL